MALSSDRNTIAADSDVIEGGMAASVTAYAGALIMRDAAGNLTPGATATGSFGVGRAEERKTNGSTAGATRLRVRPGRFWFKNSAAGDAIAAADVGAVCYIVDDETVAKTNGTNTRSPAGAVEAVDSVRGVLVRLDAALTRALLS